MTQIPLDDTLSCSYLALQILPFEFERSTVMDGLRINHRLTIPASQLDIQQVRSSGPGGQNVNKVASKVILTWTIDSELIGSPTIEARLRKLAGKKLNNDGQIQIASQQSRSAERNTIYAISRLRELIQSAYVVPKPRIPTKPSKGSVRRRLNDKNQQSDKKSSRRSTWEQ
jgi:ribosome-associated protein